MLITFNARVKGKMGILFSNSVVAPMSLLLNQNHLLLRCTPDVSGNQRVVDKEPNSGA